MTRSLVEIVTRAPIERGKSPFKPVTATVFPSFKVPSCLSSIYVPRKPSLMKTDYIHPRLDIDGP